LITEKNSSLDLLYMLALLNSRLYFQWLYHRGKRKGEMLELFQVPLSEIPIKRISKGEQVVFIKLAEKILTARNRDPDEDTTKWETEIDQLVYELYGLTPDEIKLVEESAH
jgi:adenine-specific DNA-methyltransferase